MNRRDCLLLTGMAVAAPVAGCLDRGEGSSGPATCPPETLEGAEAMVSEPGGFTLLDTFSLADGHTGRRDGREVTADTVTAHYERSDGSVYHLRILVWEDVRTAVGYTADRGLTTVVGGNTYEMNARLVGTTGTVTVVVSGVSEDHAESIEALFAATGCIEEGQASRRTWG